MWIIDRIKGSILEVWEAATGNPGVFFPILAVVSLLFWLKWRFMGSTTASVIKDNYAGWTQDGQTRTTTHETGIGTQDVLVMKPVKMLGVSVFSLIFFGGGAVFMAMVQLPKDTATTKDVLVVITMGLFALMALFMFVTSFTRVRLYTDKIERTALFRPKFTANLSEITKVTPIAKTIANGVWIHFNDGRRLRVIPRLSGYRQVLERLSKHDPKLALMTRMMAQAFNR